MPVCCRASPASRLSPNAPSPNAARRAQLLRIALAGGFAAASAPQAAHAAEHIVTAYSNMTFVPAAVTIAEGDTIRFENRGGLHNVHADDDRFVCATNCTDDTAPSSAPWSAVVRFDQPGTIGYHCDKHGGTGGGMRGTIVVVADVVFADGFDTAERGVAPPVR